MSKYLPGKYKEIHNQLLKHNKAPHHNPILHTERVGSRDYDLPLTAREGKTVWNEEESDTNVMEDRFSFLENDIIILNRK